MIQGKDPIYLKIKSSIETLMDKMEVGQRLPSERELSKHFSCNVLTVRKAMNLLVEEGKMVKRMGSGSYVTERQQSDPSMASGAKGKTLGLILHPKADAYALTMTQSLMRLAHGEAWELRVLSPSDFKASLRALSEKDALQGIDAFVFPWFLEEDTIEVAKFIDVIDQPVSVPLTMSGYDKNCHVEPDSFGNNSYESVKWVYELYQSLGMGHFAFVGPKGKGAVLEHNIKAYMDLAFEKQMVNRCALVGSKPEDLDLVVRQWVEKGEALCCLCYDDVHAIRVITAFHKYGWQAPRNYSIICYNETPVAQTTDPPMTTISNDMDHEAQAMLDHISSLWSSGQPKYQSGQKLTLRIRESCGVRVAKDLDKVKLLLKDKLVVMS
jgi:DNA-binding LacI/PurR family transcriptional regulator